MAKSQSQFRITSSSAGSSFHSNTEMYNRSGASFYTMPEAENEALIKENEDLQSQISELEASMRSEPVFRQCDMSEAEIETQFEEYKRTEDAKL
jgi:hypothetical protein